MSANAKVKTLSARELQRELKKPRKTTARTGIWKNTTAGVLADGKPRKVSDITRGSVNAGARAARDAGLNYIANYEDNNFYIIIHKPEEEAEKSAEESAEQEPEVTEQPQQ